MTTADRPSVTDNARDEEPLAWCPGCGDRIPTEVIRERGVCSNCYGTTDDPWAAGRAETTTATVEDTTRAIHRALAPRWMSVAQALGPGQDAYEAMLADIAKELADAGLLATARSHPTRDDISDATEDAARVLDDVIQHLRKIWSTGHDEAREVIDAAEELLSQALPRLLAPPRAETTATTTIRYDTFDDGTVESHEVVASNATPNRRWARSTPNCSEPC